MWFRSKPGKKTNSPATPAAALSHTPRRQSRLHRARLPVDLLLPGMRIIKLDRPWTDVPVLFQGFTLANKADVRTLRQYCDWVVVEDEEHRLAPILEQIPRLKQQTTRPFEETRPLQQELPRAIEAWNQTQAFIEQVIHSIEHSESLKLEAVRPLIRSCVESVKANASAMLWISRIKHRDAYTAEHCLRVAILSVAFARFLGLPDEDQEIAGICGLLHDIGKLQIPDDILNKPGPLSPEEYAVMQKHPVLGHTLLQKDPTLDPIISDVTLHHHERMDGRGYPDQVPEYQISRFARLVSIVDAYDAITSDRCYRDGVSPADAVRILYQNRGRQFDADMVEGFIRMIGLYPPGSLIELNTGEVALVVSTHPGRKLAPRIEILLDADKHPAAPRILDLGKQKPTDSPQREIAKPLPDGAHGISLKGRIQQLMAGTPADC